MKADIGVIGLAVMGQNLVLNIIDNGYKVAVYNRSKSKINQTLNRVDKKDAIMPCYSLKELISSLKLPKTILLMVKSGDPVDIIINDLIPLIETGDILIDGGNSNYKDTIRRFTDLKSQNYHFIGMGISGGEEGARYGPSIMPGGSILAWNTVKPIFQAIAAKKDGDPCCEWLGSDGAGHFVKTVHNGIEYGDMELIAETYDILKNGFDYDTKQIADIFTRWNNDKLESYLIEITGKILKKIDTKTGQPLVEVIMDKAGQKGTGRWTVHSSLDLGIPTFIISSAVFQRFLSAQKQERKKASSIYSKSRSDFTFDRNIVNDLENALLVAKIMSYAQGFELLKTASMEYNWDLNLGTVASIWREGCIIRSNFLDNITNAFSKNPDLDNLLLDSHFKSLIEDKMESLRNIVKIAVDLKISIPGYSSALSYFDGFTNERLPANIIQAQRDYFGAHGYKRIDDKKDHHTQWY